MTTVTFNEKGLMLLGYRGDPPATGSSNHAMNRLRITEARISSPADEYRDTLFQLSRILR